MQELTTTRGFEVYEFQDSYGETVVLQQSSAIDFEYSKGLSNPGSSYLYLGLELIKPKVLAQQASSVGVKTIETTGWVDYPVPHQVQLNGKIHLSRKDVKNLVKRMNSWLKTGKLHEQQVKVKVKK